MSSNYHPELDTSSVLSPEQANYYMSLIGKLRRAVELGGSDIYFDATLLSSYMAQPHMGHKEQVPHIFSYSTCHLYSNIVFDPYKINWDVDQLKRYD
jgi:hypothetical protein